MKLNLARDQMKTFLINQTIWFGLFILGLGLLLLDLLFGINNIDLTIASILVGISSAFILSHNYLTIILNHIENESRKTN